MKRVIVPIVVVLLIVCGIGSVLMKGKGANPADAKKASTATVTRGDIVVKVVETGNVEADKTVEVKSRVSGRLKDLFVQEGDFVKAGQLIAVIDPKETQLQVLQDRANLKGASSAASKAQLEIAQRKETAQAGYLQAKTRVEQLELESKTQPELTRNAIRTAEIALNTAKEQRRLLVESTHPNARTSAVTAVSEAESNFENATKEFNRRKELLDSGYIPTRDLESAKLTLDLARVRLAQAKEALGRLDAQFRSDIARADDSIKQADAELRRTRANAILDITKRKEYLSAVRDLDKARSALQDAAILEQGRQQTLASVSQLAAVLSNSERNLGETDVRAPITGVVTKKMLQVGELASGLSGFSAGTSILRIEDRSVLKVVLAVNEIDMAKLVVGMTATVDIDAIPDQVFTGKVIRIAPASKDLPTGTTQTEAVVKYSVEILISHPAGAIRSGMSAKCSLDVVRKEKVLTLPLEYIQKEDRKSFVYLQSKSADPKAKPEKREVKVGASTGSTAEIISGVSEGDIVVKPEFGGPKRKGAMEFGGGD